MKIVIELTTNWQTLALASLTLVLFGVFYNLMIDRLDDRHQGYTSLMVVIGVSVNLVALAVVYGAGPALVALLFFACSGFPMVAGEIIRELRKRERGRKELERLAWLSEYGREKSAT